MRVTLAPNPYTLRFIQDITSALLHLAFPHICAGCAASLHHSEQMLCLRCHASLPDTGFQAHPANPVEKMFWGRIPLTAATAQFYFTKDSLAQQLIHELKYKGNKALGLYLGRQLGMSLQQSARFDSVDLVLPLPLHPARERARGYNQAELLARSVATVLEKPIVLNAVKRRKATGTQTKMGRVARWQNMEGTFQVPDACLLNAKHVLLIDDVVTTGATLEACAREIIAAGAE